MVNGTENRRSIGEDETAASELGNLRQAAKLAAIYHSGERKFRKRTDLSHVVHASLHCLQFAFTLAIEIFHHLHHYANQLAREKDPTIPALPEERNPIFFLYPCCMLASLVLATLWLVKKILAEKPAIPLAVCATAAGLMLLTGIMEMKHADMYIDLTEITDEELLEHPVFVHNFVMCILSVFVMTIYLLQTWILFDLWWWLRRERDLSSTPDDTCASSADTDHTTTTTTTTATSCRPAKRVDQLAPIPTFDDLSGTPAFDSTDTDTDSEEPMVYCCFIDWYNYMKIRARNEPKHEFQVVHVV